MGGRYILLGGVEEVVFESGSPGELWKSEFKRGEPAANGASAEIGYRLALKEPEGVEFSKEVRVLADLPGVIERYVLRYSGKPKKEEQPGDSSDRGDGAPLGPTDGRGKDGKKRKDEVDLTFGIRLSTPSDGHPASRNVFDVPTGRGMSLVRFHRPGYGRRWRWRDWRDEHAGLAAGFLISRHEELGRVLAVLFGPRRVPLVGIRCDFQGPELMIRHAPRKLTKGRRAEFGVGLFIGDAVAASESSMLLVSKGRAGRAGVPVAFTVRTSRRIEAPRVSLATARGRKTATLRSLDLPFAGTIYTKTLTLPKGSLPLTCTATVGRESLTCRLEA